MRADGAAVPAARGAVWRASSTLEKLLGGKVSCDLDDFLRPHEDPVTRQNSDGHGRVAGDAGDIYLWDPKSFRIRMINWSHVYSAEYSLYATTVAVWALTAVVAWQLFSGIHDLSSTLASAKALASDPVFFQVLAIVVLVVAYLSRRKPSVYCLENCVFVPPKSWQVSREDIMTMMRAQGCFSQETLDFLRRVLERSGTSDRTHWPPCMIPCRDGATPAEITVDAAREEAKAVLFPLVKEALHRSGLSPTQVDILIVNCSLFVPTPSLCALVCNEFRMREDVRTYNLGGMGCSANVVAVDLAQELLQNSPGSRALVISTENLTQNLYTGNDKSMLLQNTLFRCGGCALVLSSRRRDCLRAKYKLLYTFRAQVSEDNSYGCVYQREDATGNKGVALSKDIVTVAGKAMKRNFIQLGPHVLPLREQAKVVLNRIVITLVSAWKQRRLPFAERLSAPAGYMPNFSKGIDHFCIHAGGRAVIEGVQKNLHLREDQVSPSVQTLFEWGNTSSSSIWYEADWVERHGGLKRGDRVLQIAFGSGFKCNSAVWLTLRVDDSKRGVPLRPAEE